MLKTSTTLQHHTTGRKIKCKLAAVNELCFADVNAKGRESLERLNPEILRFRSNKRNTRNNEFLESIFEEYKTTNANKNDSVDNAFDQFLNKVN